MARFQTKPISGARDFLPLDVLRRQYVIDVIERVYQSYGFEPLETPVMERLDTLLGKYGEEGDQLIFRVAKRGAKLQRALVETPTEDEIADAGLRYDLTVPLARIVAEYSNQLPRYFKRYQIAPVYRADRPAKGRYREFYQCDLDVVGSSSRLVEAEVLNAGAQVLQELGFHGRDASGFRLRLNHRGVLRGLMEVSGVPGTLESDALVAVDKLDKIGLEGVAKELRARGIEQSAASALLELMAAAPDETCAVLAWLRQILTGSAGGAQAVNELEEIVTLTQSGPAGEHIRIDPYLARGLSYYTGPTYEVEFPTLSGSGGGGGRYDDLIGMFSNRSIPACGFSFGLERILLIMEERGLFPHKLAGQPQALITNFDPDTLAANVELAHALRSAGLRVDFYPDLDNLGRQFRYAEERNIPFALLLGGNELAAGTVTIKDLISGEQNSVARADAVDSLRQRLR
ncbi:MAG: histidine--tRNA ligase [Caldilineaceae bacterium]|nr:histidine--tRNA ligase [Caldilineaceae bacterium]